ncbi:MAG: tripartite tricarboxylate transporter substrate binding protein [Betaproteobacteria bacterium]|nr:tripartite tricarboxylate transporter substrate binding protein [Betaproteobacteria bacterium]
MSLRIGKTTLATLAIAVAAGGAQAAAPTDVYPTKPIRFIVGFPPGGGNDTLARIFGLKIADRLGQPVVIDNRPGAGGNLAAALTAKSPADGYTILMISSTHPIQGLLKKNLPYDPIGDFSGIAQLVAYRTLIAVHPDVPAKSVRELIDLAKAKPGALNFVSSGNGTGSHLAGELFRVSAGVEMTHVPYKGTAQAITDLIAGRVQLMFTPLVPVIAHLKSGRLRAVAVTSGKRSRIMPELPTVAESGVPGYEFVSWYGIIGPAGLPARVKNTLNAAAGHAMDLADVKNKLLDDDMDLIKRTPEAFDGIRKANLAKWTKIVKQTGITAQ